jgi:uncharacterized protein (DUF58 family)
VYRHERQHVILIAIDASRLMSARVAGRTKLDHAIHAALALAYGCLSSGDRAGMLVFDAVVRSYLPPRRHRESLGAFIDLVRTVEPRLVEADYGALVRTLAARQRQRALIVVFSDLVEADPAMIVRPLILLARRHRVLLVAIRDPLYDESRDSLEGDEGLMALYRRLALADLAHGRDLTLGELHTAGVDTLDLSPAALTTAVLNRYLALRSGPEP